MACGKCWETDAVAGGVVDGSGANPHYRYGGLWKNLKKGAAAPPAAAAAPAAAPAAAARVGLGGGDDDDEGVSTLLGGLDVGDAAGDGGMGGEGERLLAKV